MTKREKYVKYKNLELSARSIFGRPSELDKTIDKWEARGWEVNSKHKVRNKNRYKVEFIYRMSDEEITRKKKSDRNTGIIFGAFFIFACVWTSWTSTASNQEKQANLESTKIANRATLQVLTNQRQTTEANETATATLWTLTPTLAPSHTPTMTKTSTTTNTPTMTKTPSITPTVTNSPTVTDTVTFTPSLTITNTKQAIRTNTPRPTQVQGTRTTYYITGTANIRSCPRTDGSCSVVTSLGTGDEFISIGAVQGDLFQGSSTWYMRVVNGQEQYVHSALVSKSKPAPITTNIQPSGSNQSSGNQSTVPATSPAQPPVAPSYTCGGDIYNCGDFSNRAELMEYWNACPGDPSKLDRDNDGFPCESLR